MAVTARVEHVGSLLRPSYLLEAREARTDGRLDPAAFKAVEDRAVREVLALQQEVGCPVVTDGELRRDSFQSELAAATDGFAGVDMDAWLWGEWHGGADGPGDLTVERPGALGVVAPLRARRRLAAEEFTFVRGALGGDPGRVAKVTLPSPSLFANLWSPAEHASGRSDAVHGRTPAEHAGGRSDAVHGRLAEAKPERSRDAYPTLDGFLDDVVAILQDEVRELVRLGCTYIQLDAPHYPLLIDPNWRAFYEARGWPLERWLSYGVELDNAVIDAGRPATFGFHLCRGNQRSRWLVAGGYDAIAAPIFGGVHADRLLLEYDDERSGAFDPLRLVPDDKWVVLGLVTTKTPRVEREAELERRLADASRWIDRDRLAISPQCGFATSYLGNAITVDDERRKLAVLVRTAERVFGGVR